MTPVFTIKIGDDDLTNLYRDRLISLEITDNSTEQADQLNIELADFDRKIMLPEQGTVISVGLGYEKIGIREMGKFIIDSVSIGGPPDKVTVGAYAAPFSPVGEFKPFQTRKSRSFEKFSLGKLVRTIAGGSGLVAAVTPEFEKINLPHIDQTNESDMNLLTRLARQYGAVMKPTSGHFVFAKRGAGTSVNGKPLNKITIDRSECSSYSAEWSKRGNFSKVRTKTHNVEMGKMQYYEASGDEDDDESDGPIYEHPTVYPDADSAQRGATSMMEQNNRLAETINLTISGRPDIIAEGHITLTGFKEKMNGEWLVKSVKHNLSKSGFTTTVQGESSASRVESKNKEKKAKKGKKENRAFLE